MEISNSFITTDSTESNQNETHFINEDDYFNQSIDSESNEHILDEIREKLSLTKPKKNIKKSHENNQQIFKKSEFEILGFLGKGSYANVFRAREISSGRIVALKIVDKDTIQKQGKLAEPYIEAEVLKMMDHRHIIKCYGIFEEDGKIYTILEYGSGGDLLDFIKNNLPIPLESIQFLIANIINILEYMHGIGITHRDLKPSNMILDENFEIKLVDFYTCEINNRYFDLEAKKFIESDCNDSVDKEFQFAGTAEFVAPEVLSYNSSLPEADLWSLGCMVYQMVTGYTPFKDKTDYLIFQKIKNCDIEYPEFFSSDLKDFISKLLVLDPKKRIGCDNNFNELKLHPFLGDVNFENLEDQVIPFKSLLKIKFKVESVNHQIKLQPSDSFECEVIKEGVLSKKSHKRRKIILYSNGKLDYIDPKRNIVKKVIDLWEDCEVVCCNDSKFEITTKKKKYTLFSNDDKAREWVGIIDKVLGMKLK